VQARLIFRCESEAKYGHMQELFHFYLRMSFFFCNFAAQNIF